MVLSTLGLCFPPCSCPAGQTTCTFEMIQEHVSEEEEVDEEEGLLLVPKYTSPVCTKGANLLRHSSVQLRTSPGAALPVCFVFLLLPSINF